MAIEWGPATKAEASAKPRQYGRRRANLATSALPNVLKLASSRTTQTLMLAQSQNFTAFADNTVCTQLQSALQMANSMQL